MTTLNPSRRALLRGFVGSAPSLRPPPWSVESFTLLCSRCDACIEACEESILRRGDGGFPEVFFDSGGCTFCGACVAACEEGALQRSTLAPWSLTARVAQSCLSANAVICRACGDACDARAIGFALQTGGRALVEIDIERCTGCGFCYGPCPQKSIELTELT